MNLSCKKGKNLKTDQTMQFYSFFKHLRCFELMKVNKSYTMLIMIIFISDSNLRVEVNLLVFTANINMRG